MAMFHGVRVAAKFLHGAIISDHNISLFLRKLNMAACMCTTSKPPAVYWSLIG